MSRISLHMRQTQAAATTDAVEVGLFEFSHPDLDAPVRLSTDNTERLSSDPLIYGTRSSWRGANPEHEPFLFVGLQFERPSDQEDTPAAARLVLANVSADIGKALRAVGSPPHVAMALVMAATPNVIEAEWRDLRLVSVDGDAGEIRLAVTRQPIHDEPFPYLRFTKHSFPGLFR